MKMELESMANPPSDELSPKEIEHRREAALKKMLATPPTPHAKAKKKPSPDKRKAKKTSPSKSR
jgi:hypothetical protein